MVRIWQTAPAPCEYSHRQRSASQSSGTLVQFLGRDIGGESVGPEDALSRRQAKHREKSGPEDAGLPPRHDDDRQHRDELEGQRIGELPPASLIAVIDSFSLDHVSGQIAATRRVSFGETGLTKPFFIAGDVLLTSKRG
jgi:hypothetical protein